jgi:hypothetical protein
MALKTIIAAGLAAATFAFMPVSPAEAKTKIIIGIGTPGYGYGYGNNYCYNHPRRCGGWAPRPHYYLCAAPPSGLRLYDYAPVRHKLSCGAARNLVDHSGFNKVKATECNGKVYTFRASKKGHRYVVKVNSVTGRIVGTGRI